MPNIIIMNKIIYIYNVYEIHLQTLNHRMMFGVEIISNSVQVKVKTPPATDHCFELQVKQPALH